MNILHIPFGYFPDVCGGTEVYVSALSRELTKLGHQVSVAAPGEKLEQYSYEGKQFFRYPVNSDIADIHRNGEGDPTAAAYVGGILDRTKPDIVHLHALTSGVSLLVLREASRRNIKTVLTYHTPTISCVQGTLLFNGRDVCDGVMDETRCTACSLYCLGLPVSVSAALAHAPEWFGRLVARSGVRGRWLTALRRKEMIGLRHETVRKVFAEVDHVIALCNWTVELLQLNQLGAGKISFIRHGLPHKVNSRQARQITVPDVFSEKEPLRLLCLGRISPEKGIDIIVDAVAQLPVDQPVVLDVYGLQQGDSIYARKVIKAVESDPRISLHKPVPPEDVTVLMRRYHLLLVPSKWLETGPFVVLEALYAGTPVMGSKLGGIEERVRDGHDGLLVPDCSHPDIWRVQLERLLANPAIISSMRAGIKLPQSFDEVAKAHLAVYQHLCDEALA